MPAAIRYAVPFCATVLALLGGCVAGGAGPAARSIAGILDRQAVAWNTGDIEAFMEPYWHSPGLTFSSGGKVTRGWEATLAGYHKRYPDRDAMGRLTFSDLEIELHSRRVALVLGRWHLDRDDPVGGAFSLIFRRDAGQWMIVHDHTSRDEK